MKMINFVVRYSDVKIQSYPFFVQVSKLRVTLILLFSKLYNENSYVHQFHTEVSKNMLQQSKCRNAEKDGHPE